MISLLILEFFAESQGSSSNEAKRIKMLFFYFVLEFEFFSFILKSFLFLTSFMEFYLLFHLLHNTVMEQRSLSTPVHVCYDLKEVLFCFWVRKVKCFHTHTLSCTQTDRQTNLQQVPIGHLHFKVQFVISAKQNEE